MSTFSIGGLATGLDTSSIIAKLMDLERNPERIMQANQTKLKKQVDAYKQIETALSTLQGVMQGINTSATFKGMKSTVGDSSVLTASATSTASPGTHTIQVLALARSQRQVSTGYASNTALVFNTGSFTIDDGAGTVKTVTIAEGQNSLQGITAAINASGANVTASIINDGTGTPYRLVITGKDTKNYTVNFAGLTTLPAGGTGSLTPTLLGPADPSYQAGVNASFKLDGVTITKTSNTVSDAITGVTLNLLKEGATTTFAVTNDTDGVTQKINDFIKAYNSAITPINLQSVYNPDTKTAGILSGDSTLRTVQSKLSSLLTTPVSGATGVYKTLASIGITSDKKDGTLSVDSAKLADALSNHFDDVVDLFTHNTGVSTSLPTNQYGIAQQFNLVIDTIVHPYVGSSSIYNGLIETRIKGLNGSISDIDKRISEMESRITQMQANLQKQFTAMENMVSSLQSQGSTLLNYLGVQSK